jgi:hypothetical protein
LYEIVHRRKLFGQENLGITPGSEVGKANGLSILLDAETYDYTYHLRAGEGFKLSVHHHLVSFAFCIFTAPKNEMKNTWFELGSNKG